MYEANGLPSVAVKEGGRVHRTEASTRRWNMYIVSDGMVRGSIVLLP